MVQHKIFLRAAKPAFDQGLVFARYLDQAAEGFFRFMFGPQFAEIVAKAYTKPGHDLSYQNVTFAERGNVIVGMASGFTAEQHRQSSEKPLRQAAGYRAMRLICVRVLFAPLWRILDTIAEGDFYLQAIAVDKELRGEGLGSTLIDFMEEKAIESGSARLALDVSGTNEAARRFYERCGMHVDSAWPKRLKIPQLIKLRMTKTI